MLQFLLPRQNIELYKQIDCIESTEPPDVVISESLSHYLYEIKGQIQHCMHEWDIVKKYTNPYEYIHSVVPNTRKCISRHKPLSRSYFKMIELTSFYKLIDTFPVSSMRTFHLAEGPGGFIEALCNMRKCPNDRYIGMTILDDSQDMNIPAWKKSKHFLKEHTNVVIEVGADGTGNILSLANFQHCYDHYACSMDIITGDGGFDFSMDFNNQEIMIGPLLFGQVCYALCMQKRGGSFILKVFDSFMQHTIDILAILASFYSKVYITKPQTSRYANSEKYIVCKGFLYDSTREFYPYLYRAFDKMVGQMSIGETWCLRFLSRSISQPFVNSLEEYNAIFGQQQIENIYYTITLIENTEKHDKIEMIIKSNVQKCVHWCTKYSVPYYM